MNSAPSLLDEKEAVLRNQNHQKYRRFKFASNPPKRLKMRVATFGLALALALACALSGTYGQEITFAEFRRGILTANPAKMTPQCKKVMQNCVSKMMGLMRHLNLLGEHWDQFSQVPCVKESLVGKFPDYSQDCIRSGRFGKAWNCLVEPETLASLGSENKKHWPVIMDAQKCAIENGKD